MELNLSPQRCGFVAVIGETNAGKSTLINQIVGAKVSIVSRKVQTTRRRILGITIKENSQLILVDTPGIFNAKKTLEKAMLQTAWSASRDADKIVVLVDASQRSVSGSLEIICNFSDQQPLIVVLNKIDLVRPQNLLEITQKFAEFPNIEKIFMISAVKNDGVDDLLKYLYQTLPKSPWLYPEDQISDLPQRLWAAEITREQLIRQLEHELPYETYVETESWEEFQNGSVKISQAIVVARAGQKAIIIGKSGARIKEISQAAREEMAIHLGMPVHLFLFVKVTEDWMNKSSSYSALGLEYPR